MKRTPRTVACPAGAGSWGIVIGPAEAVPPPLALAEE